MTYVPALGQVKVTVSRPNVPGSFSLGAYTSGTILMANESRGGDNNSVKGWTSGNGLVIVDPLGIKLQGNLGLNLWMQTNLMPGDRYAIARWSVTDSTVTTGYHRAQFYYYDASGNLLATSAWSGYVANTVGSGLSFKDTTGGPAGTTYVRLQIRIYANNTGTEYTGNGYVTFGSGYIRDAGLMFGTASDPAVLNSVTASVISSYSSTDLTQYVTGSTITRAAADASTASVTLVGDAFGPGGTLDGHLQAGYPITLTTTAGVPMFTGALTEVKVDFVPTNPAGARTVVTLTAADAFTQLSQATTTGLTGTIANVLSALSSVALPSVDRKLNGMTRASPLNVAKDATTSGTSLTDALIYTRDSNNAYLWVDAANVVNMADSAHLDAQTTDLGTVTASTYLDDVVIGKDTANCVNTVSVTILSGTTSTDYGPFIDYQSVRLNGTQSATYTIVTTAANNTAAFAQAYASAVLAANAEPVWTVSSITIPIHTAADVTTWAAADLYDKLTVVSTNPALSAVCRVVGITHTLTTPDPASWTMTLALAHDARAPLPTIGVIRP